jgi:hypothetical protein
VFYADLATDAVGGVMVLEIINKPLKKIFEG